MLGSFVDAAQKYFKSRHCRASVFDHPITRSPDHSPAPRCTEAITRLALLAASLFMIFLGGCAMGPGAPTTTTTNSTQGLTSINHIIFIAQENRSFDTYFGHLNDYRAKQGLPADVDGMPPAAANPADDGSMVTPFHLLTMCIENTSAAWATSHINFNRFSLSSNTPTLDGFVVEGAAAAKGSGGNDTKGVRVMGFYNDIDLISHYFLATQFGTSDRWFAPAPIETEPNRMYLVAATSVGHAHAPTNQVNATTIFDLLDQKGISWKIYLVNPNIPSELGFFAGFVQKNQSKFVPIAQYNTDLQNGTLPSVAYIDRAPGVDEHPGSGASIQVGANFVTGLITSLMGSQFWKDSVFIVTFDEHGGLYDHVSPRVNGQAIQVMMGPSAGQPATQGPYASDSNSQQVPSPDGIPPQDLFTTNPPDPPGDFDRSGFRVPLLVVSPFSKKNFVSHTPADSTAILKFIETRFGLSNLTKRDAAQIDMTEFFDFQNVPWKTPPTVPTQPTNGPCTNTLP
jgi:phospholipase C